MGKEKSRKAACYDCGLPYGEDGWIEAIIPDKVWDRIRPEGSGKGCGLLCVTCINKRLVRLGIKGRVPVWFRGTEVLRPVFFDEEDELLIMRNFDILTI